MKITNIGKMSLISILILITNSCWSSTLQKNVISPLNESIQINESVYSMDKKLLDSGYKLKDVNNNAVLMYQNEPITASQFYMSSITGDKALKLYIELTNTAKNAVIYLNNLPLPQKTNASGKAYIDLYREKGKYHLKIANANSKSSSNYYFDLDKALKLSCSGTSNFNCSKEYY